MRLCFSANPLSIHTQRWVSEFARRGHEVHLIDLRTPGRPAAPPLPGVTYHEVPKGPLLPIPGLRGLAYYPAAAARTWNIVRKLKPALLHAHYVSEHAWTAALSGFRPLVVTAWGGEIHADPRRHKRRIERLLTPWTLRQANLMTGDSGELVRILNGYRRPDTPVHLIRFGIDPAVFKPGLDTAALRRELDLGPGPVIFSPRLFYPLYRQDVLVRAFAKVLERHPGAQLVLKRYFADAAYTASLEALVAELGVGHAVRWPGETDHAKLATFFNLADVTVSIPAADGFPVTVLEAMACGSPLVMTDLPWLEDIAEVDKHILRVPVDDPDATAAALDRLLGDPALRERLRQANLAYVAEHGSWAREMDKMERAYEALVGRPV
ncbi:MAG TPA: glycosyltransferase family 4 protein [Herpetosiphonaceae bacterium]